MSPREPAAPTLTVVVPAYNAAATLGRTLDSLVVQTHQDFEVVLVDDASADATASVAAAYHDRLPQLRVVRRPENSGGVGAPRNDGIRAARGEFVMFLDSDDELPAKACEVLLSSALETGADITAGRAHRVNLQQGIVGVWQPMLYGADRYVESIDEWPELINDPIAAAKLFRTRFLIENEITFPEGVFYEDTFFSAKTYALASGISVVAEPVYRWIWETPQHGGASITNRRREIRSFTDRIRVHRLADEFLTRNGFAQLKTFKDARFIGHDVRLYMKELRIADDEYRNEFLRLVSAYLDETRDEAYELCGPLDRVRAFYLRHQLADEALTVADFEQRRSVISSDVVLRDGRVFWSARHLSLPGATDALDVTELGIQDESFANAKLFNRVTDIAVDGRWLQVAGRILNQFQRISAEDPLELVLHIRDKSSGERSVVSVGDVRVTDEDISYATSFDLNSVLHRFTEPTQVNFLLQVNWNGRRHTTALCVRGIDLEPVVRTLAGTGLEAYESTSGNLVLRAADETSGLPTAPKPPAESQWRWWEERSLPSKSPAPERFRACVVVHGLSRTEHLDEALSSLACQEEFPRTQVLLALDEADSTVSGLVGEFCGRYGNVTRLSSPTPEQGDSANGPIADILDAPYVLFMDGPGVLAENALGRLLRAAEQHGSDVVLGDAWDAGVLEGAQRFSRGYFGLGDTTFEGLDAASGLMFAGSIGGKLISRDLLPKRGLVGGGVTDLERLRAMVEVLLRAERISLVDSFTYGVPDARRQVHDRLSTTRDMLALCRGLLRDHATDEPEKFALVQRFVAGSFDSFLAGMPKMLGRSELTEIYPAVLEVYQHLADDLVLEHTKPGSPRTVHHAVKARNAELFAAALEAPDYRAELKVDGEVLYRQVVGDAEKSTILRVTSRTAMAESIRPVDGRLRVEGFFVLGGVDVDRVLENRLELVFTSSTGREHAVDVRQIYRRDRWHIRKQHDLYAGWRGDLTPEDIVALHGGSYAISLRVHGDGAFVDMPVKGRPAFHRFKGVRDFGEFRYEVSVGGDERFRLKVARSRSVAALGHRVRRFAGEVAALAGRRPGWLLRVLYWLTHPVLKRRDIWIVGERHDTAQDNGYHLFRWARENRPNRNVYYVIDADAADRSRVAPFGNVVAHGSLKHRLYLLNATRVISPYDLEAYLAPAGLSKVDFLRRFGDLCRYRRVFLQHGVTYNDVSQSAHRQSTSVDLFVAASQREADYISEEMGYRPDEVMALGFPRFDKLQSVETETPTILLMPTWRRDIVAPSYKRSLRPKVQFAASEYFRFFSRILEDERLRGALEESGVRLEFYPHYEIRPHLRHFRVDHPSITVADQTSRGVQEAMKECSLLVTDYSSVFFDVAYMGKPIVYVPFDEDDFYGRHYRRGYFDLSRDGFGPVCRSVDGAVDEIIAAIGRRFAAVSPYDQRVEDFFGRRDTDNCARVFEAVDGLGTRQKRKG